MKRNMKQWVQEVLDAPVKRAMPVLSFPAIQLMDITVRDLISIRLTAAAAGTRSATIFMPLD